MRIRLKRVYEAPADDDGVRILVDRLWPRGISKQRASIDHWLRDAAPSAELRRWYKHEPGRWDEFKRRYFAELSSQEAVVQIIRESAARDAVTLLFAARDTKRNNAVALAEYLETTR